MRTFIIGILAFVVLSGLGFADEPSIESRELSLEFLQKIKHPFSETVDIEWGFWNFMLLRDHQNDDRESRVDDEQEIYRNYAYLYADWNVADFFSSSIILRDIYYLRDYYDVRDENDGIDIYELYAEGMLNNFRLKVGRQYLKVGKGFLLRDIVDAGELKYEDDFVILSCAGGELVDISIDPYGDDVEPDKKFYVAKLNIKDFYSQLVSLYWARADDQTLQNSQYDAYYIGACAEGNFFLKDLLYYIEFIKSWGSSNVFNPPPSQPHVREDIDAWLGNIALTYSSWLPFYPQITAEILFASGDKDAGSVLSVSHGNVYGTHDQTFRSIDGFYIYGLALDPELSNILIFHCGTEFTITRDLSLLIDYYYYRKDKAEGIISDTSAYLPSADIGDEIDITCEFELNKYISFEVTYAHFFPGDAYPSGTKDEDLVQLIITLAW